MVKWPELDRFEKCLSGFQLCFSHSEPSFSQKTTFLDFSDLQQSNNITRGEIFKRRSTVRMHMLSRGPLAQSSFDQVLQNVTNMRG